MRQEYLFLVIYMGELSDNFKEDGSQRETDEDGKPVGDFHNPHDAGGEDLPHRLSGKPLQTPTSDTPPAAPARGVVQSDGYIHGDDGAYYSPGCEHTGEATAEANGVDLSDFEDSGRD